MACLRNETICGVLMVTARLTDAGVLEADRQGGMA